MDWIKMKPIIIELTEKQRRQVNPIFLEIKKPGYMVLAQVFRTRIKVGLISPSDAKKIYRIINPKGKILYLNPFGDKI